MRVCVLKGLTGSGLPSDSEWSLWSCVLKLPWFSFLSGHFPKTWWRVPRRPSAGSTWPGRSMLHPPGRTGAAYSRSWTRTRSLVNLVALETLKKNQGHRVVQRLLTPPTSPSPEPSTELQWLVHPNLDTLSPSYSFVYLKPQLSPQIRNN